MHERLSPFESIMWRVGQDPTLRLTVGTLLILERPPKEAELIERVNAAVEQAPRLRWRPDDPTLARRVRAQTRPRLLRGVARRRTAPRS